MLLKHPRLFPHRSPTGSMTFLATLLTGLFVVVTLCGVGFSFLLFLLARAQYEADASTLELATKLNVADRIGGVNLLEEASREMVFVSRQNSDRCQELNLPQLGALSNVLLENARRGHALIESERQNQIASVCKDAQVAARDYNKANGGKSSLSFFDLNFFQPEILRVDLGQISGVDSSVRDLNAIPELSSFDTSKKYVNPKSKLYKSDLSLKLPNLDSDLDFYLSSLPAYTNGIASPSRMTNEAAFVPYGSVFTSDPTNLSLPKQIPSAVRVVYRMKVAVPWDRSRNANVEVVGTGTTSGASLDSN